MAGLTCMLFILLTVYRVYGQTSADLCTGCKMVNGAGYIRYPPDCNKFVQCNYNADGALIGQVKQCTFSTYWNEDILTCSKAKDMICDTDICIGHADGTLFGAEANCRGFWRCYHGKAEAYCCPLGKKYTDVFGCVDDVDNECVDTCLNEPELKQPYCDKRGVVGKPYAFQQRVGWGWVDMMCAPGTFFVQGSCRCSQFSLSDPTHLTCKPEVNLTFTTDHSDQSDNGYYVANENVDISDGVAIFNGYNSRLIIPRFTNLEHSTTVIIKAKYRSSHAKSERATAIVTNSDCGNVPSIMIAEDYANIYYAVGTSDADFKYTYVPQQDLPWPMPSPMSPSIKNVVYRFDDGKLTGSNAVESVSVPAPGYLKNVKCALQIGHGENLQPFEGEIDEITVHLCNPDNP